METLVEISGWEHECCGPSYERNSVVELTCLVLPAQDDRPATFVETHHGPEVMVGESIEVHGRVVDVRIQHPDGSTDAIERLPSGRALRGVDEHDDGHLEQPWTGEPVKADSDCFVITVAT